MEHVLKHIGPLGLAFLTNPVKTALNNNNIIPHIWNLANIVPITKPNKDIDKGREQATSYRSISLLTVILLLLFPVYNTDEFIVQKNQTITFIITHKHSYT